MQNKLLRIILFHHFKQILGDLHREGIIVIPLKGAHLLTSVYPLDDETRHMGDIDFLVHPNQWKKTLSVMSKTMTRRNVSYDESRGHEVGFGLDVGGGQPLLFEVHRYLFDPRRIPIDIEDLWRRSYPSRFEGHPCRRLSNEDALVYLALHEALHRLLRLETALKDAELLVATNAIDWTRTNDLAKDWNASRSLWLLLKILDERSPYQGLSTHLELFRPPQPARAFLEGFVINESRRRLLWHDNSRLTAAMLWPFLFDRPAGLAQYVINHPKILDTFGFFDLSN